jgi:hypothetical protein
MKAKAIRIDFAPYFSLNFIIKGDNKSKIEYTLRMLLNLELLKKTSEARKFETELYPPITEERDVSAYAK